MPFHFLMWKNLNLALCVWWWRHVCVHIKQLHHITCWQTVCVWTRLWLLWGCDFTAPGTRHKFIMPRLHPDFIFRLPFRWRMDARGHHPAFSICTRCEIAELCAAAGHQLHQNVAKWIFTNQPSAQSKLAASATIYVHLMTLRSNSYSFPVAVWFLPPAVPQWQSVWQRAGG